MLPKWPNQPAGISWTPGKRKEAIVSQPSFHLSANRECEKCCKIDDFLTRPFILTFFVISKTCAFTSSFVFSHFFVVSHTVTNDTTNHFRMISALGGGISFLVLNRILSGYPFFTSSICLLKVWSDVSLFPSWLLG